MNMDRHKAGKTARKKKEACSQLCYVPRAVINISSAHLILITYIHVLNKETVPPILSCRYFSRVMSTDC